MLRLALTLNLNKILLSFISLYLIFITFFNTSLTFFIIFPISFLFYLAATIQNVLRPSTKTLSQTTDIIQPRQKFTAINLLQILILTLLKKPNTKTTNFQSTTAQLNLHITSTAVKNHFTPQLIHFLHAILKSHHTPHVNHVTSNHQPTKQIHKHSHPQQQYHHTTQPTNQPVPPLWRFSCSLLAAIKIHLL